MHEPIVVCPNCKTEVKLTESLAAPLVESTRRHFEAQLAAKERETAEREAAVKAERAALAQARAAIDEQVAAKLKTERAAIAAEEARRARQFLADELEQQRRETADLAQLLKQRDEKLAEAQKAQVELIRKQRELDDAKREMPLTIEKEVQASLDAVREQARREALENASLKAAEKDKTIADLQAKLQDALRKAEQGSQQMQGEILELTLEAVLASEFPQDVIDPVPKGEHGGDILQRVAGPAGQPCGTILWESKRTKNWSDGWLAKLREDQRSAKAELAVIVSCTLPKHLDTFDLVDGVYITGPRTVVPVAIVLRQLLIELALARSAGEGQQSKMELVYRYLTGPRFRQRFEAIVEKVSDMKDDLEKERRWYTRSWAKREEQIRAVIDSTAGMFGDLQGIAGKSLEEIAGLAVPLLTDESDDERS